MKQNIVDVCDGIAKEESQYPFEKGWAKGGLLDKIKTQESFENATPYTVCPLENIEVYNVSRQRE